jgi:hypothetical protein
MGRELLPLEPGATLNHGRYSVLFSHHSTENAAYAVGHSTYIAKDERYVRISAVC